MNHHHRSIARVFLVAVLTLTAAGSLAAQQVYDGWQQSSRYVEMRDGIRLAIEIIRPTLDGELVEEPLPAIWTHSRYHRAKADRPGLNFDFDYLETVVKHGYVVAAVDVRGAGASFGQFEGWLGPREAEDAYDITEWLAAQPWVDGNIGMYGRSYLGITQYFAASENPPHLKAIFPEMAWFDEYRFSYPGGIYQADFLGWWNTLTKNLDHSIPFEWFGSTALGTPVRPVDGEDGEALLQAAIADHNLNRDMVEMWTGLPYRDSVDPRMRTMTHYERSVGMRAEAVSEWGGGMYHVAGWMDAFPLDALLWVHNTSNPQKMIIGPWMHTERELIDMAAEHIRWFDFWLKGIENGVMDEPKIRYWTLGAPEGEQWRTAETFPLPNEKRTDYYFAPGRSGTIDSPNDGMLLAGKSATQGGRDERIVDYTTTTGTATRWTNTYGKPGRVCSIDECGDGGVYPDMRDTDRKALTYTTPAFSSDTEITGIPVVHLWFDFTAEDADFFVVLEEVTPDGYSNYITEGMLRASHRAQADPPYDFLGLPWQRSHAEDVQPLGDGVEELSLVLLPTSVLIDAGNRVRVSVRNADRGNHRTPVITPAPTVTIYHGQAQPSRIELPIIPGN